MSTNSSPEVAVVADADLLAAVAADRIIEQGSLAIRQRGRFTLVLSGGSTPEKTYALLSDQSRQPALDWNKTYLFFGDERFVPLDDPRSNYHMAQASLLSKIQLPSGHLFPVPTSEPTPAAAARAYAESLAEFFGVSVDGAPPSFDLVLLGMGDDGHTASLFPGAAALLEDQAWVTWSPPGTLPPLVDRVTFTFPLLNAARQVLFLVTGEKKAAPVREVLWGRASATQHPAAGVRPSNGTLTWLLDRTAAPTS